MREPVADPAVAYVSYDVDEINHKKVAAITSATFNPVYMSGSE